jgi:hypothetical protein
LVSELVFGESFHCLETVNYHPWVAYILKAVKFHAVTIALSYSGLGAAVQMLHRLGGYLALSKIQEYTNSMLKSRLEIGKGRNDLFEGLARKQEEWGLSFAKLSRNATVLLLAGSETTATTLSGATYFLLSNPDILNRLKQEIRSTFSCPEEITIASVSKCSYLLAVLNETLRCYPPLTAGMVRVVPAGGAEIAGQYIPQGVSAYYPQPVWKKADALLHLCRLLWKSSTGLSTTVPTIGKTLGCSGRSDSCPIPHTRSQTQTSSMPSKPSAWGHGIALAESMYSAPLPPLLLIYVWLF